MDRLVGFILLYEVMLVNKIKYILRNFDEYLCGMCLN